MKYVPSRIDRCPSCSGRLEIRELWCPSCEIQLRGSFEAPAAGPFQRLTADQAAFLGLFVASRGNLSDLERTLGVSYPTVRAKLDELIDALVEPAGDRPTGLGAVVVPAREVPAAPAQPATPGAEPPPTRQEILSRIADGRLSAQEGMALLKRAAARR